MTFNFNQFQKFKVKNIFKHLIENFESMEQHALKDVNIV